MIVTRSCVRWSPDTKAWPWPFCLDQCKRPERLNWVVNDEGIEVWILTERAASAVPLLSVSTGSIIPSFVAIARSLSSIIGNGNCFEHWSVMPAYAWISFESRHQWWEEKRMKSTLIHSRWSSTESQDKPMSFVFRLANSGASFAARANSVVQTGV